MLYEQPEIQEKLRQIAHSLTHRAELWDDLWQVGWTCLWRTEAAEPDQTVSYYLHRCKLRMLDELQSGRSIDSPKRQHLGSHLPDDANLAAGGAGPFSTLVSDPGAFARVRDLIAQLLGHLDYERDREIFAYLAQGWTVGEIALEFGITPSAVCQRRAHIALCTIGI